ncbi:AMP-binding protein [Streptomyces sp. NPDC005811]|uniref:AMP-binding protein n=1 Tax=Streptomyces sp. NPDC005811 TaxID=3154565 RepID=UPI0033ED4BA7
MNRTEVVPGGVLQELARASSELPREVFLVFDDVEHTFSEVYAEVMSMGRGLREAGVAKGDRALIMMPNRIEAVWSWFGLHAAGAVDGPASVEAKGASLQHLVTDLAPRVAIGAAELLRRVAETVPGHGIELAVVLDGEADPEPLGPGVRHHTFDDVLARGRTDSADLARPQPDELATIMYSSGSSGPPKGVMLSHGYYANIPMAHHEAIALSPGEVMYCAQPLCHIDPRMAVLDVLYERCRLVLASSFSASRFWSEVERHDADVFCFIGAMLPLVFKQPANPSGPGRRRRGLGSAIPKSIHDPFTERFNVELLEGYGMTEAPAVCNQYPGEGTPGNVGRPLPGVELCVADRFGVAVADGEVGELLVRPTRPHAVMMGYWRRPEATVEAWRGLWMHTGDLARRRTDGTYEYVGRLKDSIRRRGENVSAWEVERVALTHPLVLEAAAIGVPSEVGEEDVALVIVPHRDGPPDPRQLRSHVAADLPRYAVPRFIDIVDSLPKTPSERVAKAVLRERGLTSRVYDAERDREATARSTPARDAGGART